MSATIPERRRLPTAERRAVILAAAGPLFARDGYAGTRLDDVAAAAGVTKPILYRHFDSKKARPADFLRARRRSRARPRAGCADTADPRALARLRT
jgi:AcrR family transcriptional regulator